MKALGHKKTFKEILRSTIWGWSFTFFFSLLYFRFFNPDHFLVKYIDSLWIILESYYWITGIFCSVLALSIYLISLKHDFDLIKTQSKSYISYTRTNTIGVTIYKYLSFYPTIVFTGVIAGDFSLFTAMTLEALSLYWIINMLKKAHEELQTIKLEESISSGKGLV